MRSNLVDGNIYSALTDATQFPHAGAKFGMDIVLGKRQGATKTLPWQTACVQGAKLPEMIMYVFKYRTIPETRDPQMMGAKFCSPLSFDRYA